METGKEYANQPECFDDLSREEQRILLDWVDANFYPTQTFNRRYTSYGLKHLFENSPDGFYIYNGAMKGAMLKCGYSATNKSDINWSFNISQRSPALKQK